MKPILVLDIPARLFHWAFAASLSASLAVAFVMEGNKQFFRLHMLFGIIALFLLGVRIVMGFAGSRYSRFSSFPLKPGEVLDYMKSALFGKTKLYAGNNPGSASAAVIMFLLVPALFITGVWMRGEMFEEVHELLAWSLIAVIMLHLLGLAWHTIRHRENISLVMITGRKPGLPENGISSPRLAWGVVMLIVTAGWVAALFGNYNPTKASVQLPVIGVTVPLGEETSAKRGHGGSDDD